MKTSDIKRMAALDTVLRDLIAHEGYTDEVSALMTALMTEQEALLALWLSEAEAKYVAHMAGGE
jgi:NADH:ubiquinone oxidoreductase subunit E